MGGFFEPDDHFMMTPPSDSDAVRINLQNPVRRTILPAEYHGDSLFVGRFFYVIPQQLLSLVVQEIGREKFLSEALRRESGLARACAGSTLVGFWNQEPVSYPYLVERQPVRFSISDSQWEKLGWDRLGYTRESFASTCNTADERLAKFDPPVRAYLGWLMTNKVFLDEHDELLRQHAAAVRREGLPTSVSRGSPHLSDPEVRKLLKLGSVEDPFFSALITFCERWRLQGLVGPGLPLPLAPRVPALGPNSANAGHRGTFFIPDIFPVIGSGVFAETIEDSVRSGNTPEHLDEWMQVVRRDNTAKNIFPRYGRLFCIQHCWRLLAQRHADVLPRNEGKLIRAFGQFLRVSEETVKNGIQQIKRHLGSEWCHRPDPLGAEAFAD